MAVTKKAKAGHPDPLSAEKAMAALVALLAADREERITLNPNGKSVRKTELVLSAAGLTPTEIAPLVGKNLEAVRKTIQRGRDK